MNTLFANYSSLRPLSFSIAYRMLGSVADAEDVVQEAFLRLHNAVEGGTDIESPKAFIGAVTTRLAIDHLRSARVRRESYVGSWLPEPIVEGEGQPQPAQRIEMDESLSLAFLTVLETLSPTERAVFLLREVFDYGYDEISRIIDKGEDNCRQLFVRAKRHLEGRKPRFQATCTQRDEFARRFFAACERGELAALVDLLASDVTFYGDGGGKATAVPHPLLGSHRVARFLKGLFGKGKQMGVQRRLVTVNGEPGAMFFDSQNRLISIFALEIRDDRVVAIRSVVNPDKLQHLGPVSNLARLPSKGSDDKEGVIG